MEPIIRYIYIYIQYLFGPSRFRSVGRSLVSRLGEPRR